MYNKEHLREGRKIKLNWDIGIRVRNSPLDGMKTPHTRQYLCTSVTFAITRTFRIFFFFYLISTRRSIHLRRPICNSHNMPH
jgi:hypothetical protein